MPTLGVMATMGRLPHLGPGTAPSPLRAVLFDMDGTLVETEQLWGEAMFELAARLGGRMSEAARQRTVGTSMRTSMQVLHADLGIRRTEAGTSPQRPRRRTGHGAGDDDAASPGRHRARVDP